MTDECECSDEYGPCEIHGITLCQREGASLRTADELALQFVADAYDVIAAADADIPGTNPQLRKLKEIYDHHEAKLWCNDWLVDGDDSQALHDDVLMVESWLPDETVCYWEDGYRIVKLTSDCPLRF